MAISSFDDGSDFERENKGVACTAPHAVLLPYPLQGHINPMAQLAKLLAKHGARVTVVHTRHNYSHIAAANQPTSHNIHYMAIDDGLPAGFDYSDLLSCAEQFHQGTLNMEAPFRRLLMQLSADKGRPTCLVFGSFYSWAPCVASDLGIPTAFFWTQSATVMDVYYHHELLDSHGFFPFSQFTTAESASRFCPVDYIPGVPPLHPTCIPTLVHVDDTTNPSFRHIAQQMDTVRTCEYVLINSFLELEREAYEALYQGLGNSSVYLIGPLLPSSFLHDEDVKDTSVGASLLEEENACIKWLDNQERGSVLYVSFGSLFQPSAEEYKALALGVQASRQPFLWVVKPRSSLQALSDVLPESFLDETGDRGLIIPWAPQLQVLSHPSVGAFLSHCGWNSSLESISLGVPILSFPFSSDQPTNCAMIVDVWKVGLKLERGDSGRVEVEEVARLVRRALCDEEGRELKENVIRLKHEARKAMRSGGSSRNDIGKFVQGIMPAH